MKQLLTIIAVLCFSFNLSSQTPKESILKQMKIRAMNCNELYIEGLKEIRHDAIIRFRFRYAHQLKKEIKQLKQQEKFK